MVGPDYDDAAWAVARTKFGLIAPAVNGTFPDASRTAYFRRMEGTPVVFEDGRVRLVKASTMADWLRRYEQGGLEALLPATRSDKGRFRRLDAAAAAEAAAIADAHPRMPATVVYEELVRRGVVTRASTSLSTVQRFLRARRAGARPEQRERRSFEAEVPNGIWQADTLYGPFADDGGRRRRAYLQTIVDDKSRLIVGSRFTPSDDAASFQALLKSAVLARGVPAKLYVDNGGPYANSQLKTICASIGCVLSHAPVADGAAKGKIERLNRTVRDRFLSRLDEDCGMSFEQLNDALAAWVAEYNATAHSSTGQTPADLWGASAHAVRRVDPARADSLFRNRVERTVTAASTIRLGNVDYDVPMGHAREKALVSFTPGDPSDVWVGFGGGAEVRVAPTDRVGNASRRRSGPRYRVDYSQG